MKIDINNHRKIFFIQSEFSSLFPNLSIGFYAKPSKQDASSSRKLVQNASKTLADCRSNNETGFITILPEMTAGQLHQNFGDVYSLSIDVFPKDSESTWSQVPVAGDGTLQELNDGVKF